MSNFSKIFQQALPRPSALSALARWVKSLSGRGAEGATSALSLAMLVFLVQEARANAPVSAQDASSALPEGSSLDTVQQLFDAEGRSAGEVAGIAYSDIVQAVSQIYAAYEAELALGDDAVRADAVDTAAMDAGAEMAVLDSYVQEAIQYAALPPEMVGMDGGADAPAAPKEADDDRGFLPFLAFGVGLALVSSQDSRVAVVAGPKQEFVQGGGSLADGYIRGAMVFQDLNNNGVWDEGEPKAKALTDAFGRFSIDLVKGSNAPLVATGGFDKDEDGNDIPFTGVFKAPPGATVITPLTTLLQALLEADKTLSLSEAKAVLAKAYSLSGQDMLTFDPWSDANVDSPARASFIKANLFIANTLVTGAALLHGAANIDGVKGHDAMADALVALLQGRFDPAAAGYGYGEFQDMDGLQGLKGLSGLLKDAAASMGLSLADDLVKEVASALANRNRALDEVDLSDPNAIKAMLAVQTAAQVDLVKAILAFLGGSTAALSEQQSHDITFKSPTGPSSEYVRTLNLLAGASDPDKTHTLMVENLKFAVDGSEPVSLDELNQSLPILLSFDGETVTLQGSAFNYLNAGESYAIVVTYDLTDGKGNTTSVTRTIVVQGEDTSEVFSVSDALAAFDVGDVYGDGDTVTVVATGEEFTALKTEGVNKLTQFGVDVVRLTGGGHLSSDFYLRPGGAASMADQMLGTHDANTPNIPMRFDPDYTVTLDVAVDGKYSEVDGHVTGSQFSASLSDQDHMATGGLSLADLGNGISGLGVDVIDVVGADGTPGNYTVHISGADAVAVNEAKMSFAALDTIKLDLNQSSNSASEQFSSKTGFGGLSLIELGKMGVDEVHVSGVNQTNQGDFTLHIDGSQSGVGVSGHLVTMDVHAGTDYAVVGDHVTGSFIAGSLSDSDGKHSALGGMTLATLHGLGVDVIDIVGQDGMQGSYTVHIGGTEAAAMAAANVNHEPNSSTYMHFAADDTIKLDLSQSSDASADHFTAGKVPFGGLNLVQLAAMGVDEVHVSGVNQDNLGNFTLHIDAAPAPNTLTGHMVSVDVPLETGNFDGQGHGSHLASSLGVNGHIGGLTLSQIHGLGVDVIDIVAHDGTPGDLTAHVSVVDAANVYLRGLAFESSDHIVMNMQRGLSDLPGGTSGALDGALAHAVGIDAVQFAGGPEIALFGDQGLLHLLTELTTSNAGAFNGVTAFAVNDTANFTVSDSMVKALLDAGLFTADVDSTIKVDATDDTDGHVMTTLAQLAHIGADQVEVKGNVAYIDLGNVTDTAELTSLFDSLIAKQAHLVTNAANEAVSDTGLLLTASQGADASLTGFIEGKAAALSAVGISNVYVAGAQDSDDLLLGTEQQPYHKLGFAG